LQAQAKILAAGAALYPNKPNMNEVQAIQLIAEVLGVPPLSATHQTFGHNSITFDLALSDRNVILRTNTDPQVFATTERNLAVLAGLGLPVPTVIASDFTLTHYPFAFMILNKIPGRDLRYELGEMTPDQMTRLAEQIVGFQRQVWLLPQGSGYGYVGIGETGPYASWWELVCPDENTPPLLQADTSLGLWQVRVQERMRNFESYFRAVPPTGFLDDVTVKNVIVQNGELQGLVDFDCVCYGDPLYWLALTVTGVVSDVGTHGLFYVQELKRLWKLTAEQEKVLALYSAGMALDFLRRFSEAETPEWNVRMLAAMETWVRMVEQNLQ
jgi:aminoglycoside phosphotransferase (APT) family kinase protein